MVPIYNFNGALSDNNNLLDDLGDGSRYDTLFILSFHNKAIKLKLTPFVKIKMTTGMES